MKFWVASLIPKFTDQQFILVTLLDLYCKEHLLHLALDFFDTIPPLPFCHSFSNQNDWNYEIWYSNSLKTHKSIYIIDAISWVQVNIFRIAYSYIYLFIGDLSDKLHKFWRGRGVAYMLQCRWDINCISECKANRLKDILEWMNKINLFDILFFIYSFIST